MVKWIVTLTFTPFVATARGLMYCHFHNSRRVKCIVTLPFTVHVIETQEDHVSRAASFLHSRLHILKDLSISHYRTDHLIKQILFAEHEGSRDANKKKNY